MDYMDSPININTPQVQWQKTKIALAGLLFFAFASGLVIGLMAFHYLSLVKEARADIQTAYSLWQDKNFMGSMSSAQEARDSLARIQKLLNFKILFKFPFIGETLAAGEQIVKPSVSTLDSYINFMNTVEKIKNYGDLSYEQLPNKKEAVALIGSLLRDAANMYDSSKIIIDTANKIGLGDWPTVQEVTNDFKRFEAEDVAVAKIFHPVLEKEEMTYLILIQNNRKLMPAGGYIGNFGILKVKSGEVVDFFLKDTPKFDRENKAPFAIVPPAPLAAYYGKTQWSLTDANWSPSFPLAAQQAQGLYKAQGGTEKIDGVIAFSPEIVNGWLDLVGGVDVYGIHYDSKNFPNTPQYVKPCKENETKCQETKLVGGKTIESKDRVYIMNPIAQAVRTKLIGLPLKNIIQAVMAFTDNVKEQKIFFYFNDPALQAHVADGGFAGDLLNSQRDYLMVVDSNVSDARLDEYVSRKVDYKVKEVDNKLQATLTLTYNYQDIRKIDPKLPNYRNYLRVYALAGAKFISVQGAAVDQSEELGKKVFGAFVEIATRKEKTITLTYELPSNVRHDGVYELTMQKQLGNEYATASISVPQAGSERPYLWQGKLNEDKIFKIKQ
ncbi:MAG: DUF4012 domain-containing protein [Patescibacteria group bacterium]